MTEIAKTTGQEIEQLRAENRKLRAELQELKKSSKEYLQNVAHQLTAPLGAIKWGIESLRKPEVHLERKQSQLTSIYSQATILVHLIANFALMSNLESSHELGLGGKPESVDILALTIGIVTDYQPQAVEGGKKIEVITSSFQNGPVDSKVTGVKNTLAQAISNLVENAVKYSDTKTTITVFAEPVLFKDSGKAGLGLTVKSIGLPISPNEVPHLQERSFRGKQARQKVPAGTGIGLYLARRIMESNHGTIRIQARGKESQFTLIFPPFRTL
ncbi:MAG: HAMP domain-containing sensor histidine kinase [Bryobacteraceae bacterium]